MDLTYWPTDCATCGDTGVVQLERNALGGTPPVITCPSCGGR